MSFNFNILNSPSEQTLDTMIKLPYVTFILNIRLISFVCKEDFDF